MKKFLIATTALALTAGAAVADVKISGYGRTGVLYVEDGVKGPDSDTNNTIIQSRLRMNIDASTSSDAGVDFGGRIRVQWDQGDSETTVAPGYIYVTANGLRVEIGNANTAYDSAGLIYAPEIGVFSRSFGDSPGNFFAYNTDGYPSFRNTVLGEDSKANNYLGIMASYTIAGVTVRGSYVDPDQINKRDMFEAGYRVEKEYGLSADYTWNNVELSAAAVWNGAAIDGNDQYFVGARYSWNDVARVGLSWMDNGIRGDGSDLGDSIVLYGDYKVAPMTLVNGYVAHNDADGNENDNAFGIGAEYDLGGAKVMGSVQRGFNELVTADMGVRFDF